MWRRLALALLLIVFIQSTMEFGSRTVRTSSSRTSRTSSRTSRTSSRTSRISSRISVGRTSNRRTRITKPASTHLTRTRSRVRKVPITPSPSRINNNNPTLRGPNVVLGRSCNCAPHQVCSDRICQPQCSYGYQWYSLTSSCKDYDECAGSPCSPNERCTNTIGSYRCSRLSGSSQGSNPNNASRPGQSFNTYPSNEWDYPWQSDERQKNRADISHAKSKGRSGAPSLGLSGFHPKSKGRSGAPSWRWTGFISPCITFILSALYTLPLNWVSC